MEPEIKKRDVSPPEMVKAYRALYDKLTTLPLDTFEEQYARDYLVDTVIEDEIEYWESYAGSDSGEGE
jgi:hypothetical protein